MEGFCHKLNFLCRFVFLLFLLPQVTEAQDNSIKFRNLDIHDGLSQSSVNAIIQDRFGFIWLGTQDGLNRYDGYSFTVYKNDPKSPYSLPDNFVHALLEDEAGNFWIGTENGLSRFDRSLNRFFNLSSGAFSGNPISSLAEGKDGIWVGTQTGGLLKITGDSTVISYPLNSGTEKINSVQSLYFDKRSNILWVGTTGKGLIKHNPKTGESVSYRKGPEGNGLTNDLVWSIESDGKNIWAGTNSGLNRIDGVTGKITAFKNGPGASSLSGDLVRVISRDKAGNLWVGTEGSGLNLFEPKTGKFRHFKHQALIEGSLVDNTIYSIFEDRSGIVWVGTNRGLSTFDITKQHFIHFRNIPYDPTTISSDIIWSILENRRGRLIVGHDKGLDVFDEERRRIRTVIPPTAENIKPSVYALLETRDEGIWAGTDGGIFRYNAGGVLVPYHHPEIPEPVRIYVLVESKSGEIWAGTRDGLFIIDPTYTKVETFNANSHPHIFRNNIVRTVLQTADGSMWIGTNGAGAIKVSGPPGNRTLKTVSAAQGLNNNIILSLYEDPSGIVYLGTYGGGVNIYDPSKGSVRFLTEQDGLTNNVVYSIYRDSGKKLWMSTNKGISAYDPSTGKVSGYFQPDGLQSNEFNIGAHFQAGDGEMFFGGINGFNAFYPDRITRNNIPPQIVITGLRLFNKAVKPGENAVIKKDISVLSEIELSYREDVITLEFAGLHFSSPEQNTYAYILEGFDENWNYVKGQRQVTYTNLDPGEYIFKVKGSNSDGVWSSRTAALRIVIKPPFWQTWWFRVISGVSLVIVGFGLYKSRVAIIESQKRYLEQQVLERTAKISEQKEKIEAQKVQLEVEKDKVEKLLLNILPQETVEELKNKGKASARHYRMATVMFTDFKGFTKIAEQIRPKELVAELDRYFIIFDGIVEKYGLEKIKTIGDAYMCAGGIPIRNKSNPIDMVLAALEIQRYMEEDKKEKIEKGLPPWELRIGIHTGELIAGVVGIKRFAYDIWGDTVNVASRMESNGEIGKVNISGVTHHYIKEFFDCHYRGKVDAKNKGEIDMYYVKGIREGLSKDEARIVPNELFRSTLTNALFYKINYKKAEQFILKKLEDELPGDLYYHGLHHTIDVRDAAERIGKEEGIMGEDMMVLKTAAMYHDAGFIKQYFKNEPIGVEMAREILPDFGYSPQQIRQVEELIMATQVPQKASNLMEMILCDADLDYLGRDDFHPIAETLKMELMARGKVKSDKEWDAIQITFLEHHRYFTHYSRAIREPEKQKRIAEIKQRYAEDRYVSVNP